MKGGKVMDLSGYRHVIWDWNGTLLNDAWLGVEILNGILVSRHRPAITLDEYQEEFCIPVKPYYEKLGFDFSVESYDAISTEFIENYDLRRFECELQEHALAVLRSVPRRGMSQSILTAYQQCRLEEIILHFQIGDFFVEMLGLDNHYASSKIENGRRLVESLGISPLDILLIGDTLHDYEVARAIGVDCVLVASGHTSRERLETAGCCVLGSLGEVGS